MTAPMFARGLSLLVSIVSLASAAIAAPPPQALRAGARAEWMRTGAGLRVAPLAEVIRARVGSPVVIPFRVACSAPFPRVAPVWSLDDKVVRIIDRGQIGADRDLGFALVEGLSEGETQVTIAGRSVRVIVARGLLACEETGQPRIIAPLDGAGAWGIIGVCVAWWRPDAPADAPPKMVIDRSATPPIDAVWSTTAADGPNALAAYFVDTSKLAEGPQRFYPAWENDLGERVGEATALTLRIFHPASELLIAGECEAIYDLPPLPDERKEGAPRFGKSDKASGGAYFDNAGSSPHFRFPIEVSSDAGAGWYQVVLAAGGDEAVSTLPAVGISIGEAQYPITRSPIAMPGFHRTPIGLPVRLEPGAHVLRTNFLNDFYVGGAADRNLRLDRIEVLRVADAGDAPSLSSESSAMMAMAGGNDAPMVSAAQPPADEGTMSMAAMSGASGRNARMNGEASADEWPASAASRASKGDPAVVAFARPLDGGTACGDLEIRAAAWWLGIGDKNAKHVRTRLMLNGSEFAEQYAAAPRFVVPWEALAADNRLTLVIDGPGISATSAEARISAVKAASESAQTVFSSAFIRFTIHDPHWDAAARTSLTTEQGPPEKACFAMFGNAEVTLHLPVELTGEFELDLEARGQSFNGPPELTVTVEHGREPAQAIGTMAIGGGWDPVPVLAGVPADKKRIPAKMALAHGPKTLRVAFINDAYEEGKGDRNVFVQAVVLRAVVPPATVSQGLSAAVLYPPDGQAVRAGGGGGSGADAIVFAPTGNIAPRTAELVVDGRATGQIIDTRGKLGPLVLPVSLREFQAGDHDVAVRLTQASGASFTTAGRRVHAVAEGDEATTYERAVTVLDRFAFGPDERELAAILTLGPERYLRERIIDRPASLTDDNAHRLASARYPNSSSAGDVQRRAIVEALSTTNPVRMRFTLWAQNHFSTWIRKTEARRKAEEHERFCALGIAPFADLLLASATSPAMLRYLDQEQSYARRLNENYAREIMELHTLGVRGGYTQEDVTALARILTGWTTTRESFVALDETGRDGVGPDEYGMRETFRYDPALADNQPRTLLGRTFPAADSSDRHRRVLAAIAMLAAHPSTARFISTKLVEHSLACPAPAESVERLASTFERTGGDMGEVLMSLAADPAFSIESKRLCHPPEFAFRLARCLGYTDANPIHEYLNLTGHGMFDRSTPDGYPEVDSEQMDSNAMLQRWKLARRLESPLFELVPAARRYGDKPISDAEVQNTIDLIALRLTGRLLNETSNAAAANLLQQTAGKRDERWRTLATFIASTPEAQLK